MVVLLGSFQTRGRDVDPSAWTGKLASQPELLAGEEPTGSSVEGNVVLFDFVLLVRDHNRRRSFIFGNDPPGIWFSD